MQRNLSCGMSDEACNIWCSLVQVVWHGYVQAMRQAGFTGDLVLYVASGLLTYGANEGKLFVPVSPNNPPEAKLMVMICWVVLIMVSKLPMWNEKVIGSPERSAPWW